MKKIVKEGAKRGVEIEGAADMGGLQFFCTSLDEPAGDVDWLYESLKAMNQKSDPTEEERKGGSGRIGKMITSKNQEDTKLALVAYVPPSKQVELPAKVWMQDVLERLGGGEIVFADATTAKAVVENDADKGLFVLKLKDMAITESINYLKSKGLFPDKVDDDSDDDYVFGDDDFPTADVDGLGEAEEVPAGADEKEEAADAQEEEAAEPAEAAAEEEACDVADPSEMTGQEEVNEVTAMTEADEETPVEEAVVASEEQTEEVQAQESVTEEINEPAEEKIAQEEPSVEVAPSEEQAEVVQAEELVTEEVKELPETLDEKATVGEGASVAEEATVVPEVVASEDQAEEVQAQESVTEVAFMNPWGEESIELAEEKTAQEAPSVEVAPSEEQAEVVQAEELVTEEVKELAETLEEKATVAPAQLPAVDELSPSQQDEKEKLADIPQLREIPSSVSAASSSGSFMSANSEEQQAPAAAPNTAAKRKRGGRGGRKGRGNGN